MKQVFLQVDVIWIGRQSIHYVLHTDICRSCYVKLPQHVYLLMHQIVSIKNWSADVTFMTRSGDKRNHCNLIIGHADFVDMLSSYGT